MSDSPDLTDQCPCAFCAMKIDFDIDPHLMTEVEKHNCVIFAGAGISTETKYAHPDTFYETLLHATKGEDLSISFPAAVDRFEAQPNGRQRLVQLILDRFAYIDSFRELKLAATRFHRELATMPYFPAIITTNWDRYFEDITGATPFVYEEDVPFWEVAERPVLKIHGSIDNYSSIVASTEDYEKCATRLRDGALGAVLKQIFATRTCVFCGYSATDEDFLTIYNSIRSGLGAFARTHYLVSPHISESDVARLRELNIVAIKTDGAHFLSVVKQHMVEKFCFADDDSLITVANMLDEVMDEHFAYSRSYMPKASPHLIFSSVSQDGIIHALQRIIDLWKTGKYADLHFVRGQIGAYSVKVEEYRRERDYYEIAYLTGYMNGLQYYEFINTKEEEAVPPLPLYFHPKLGELNRSEFDAAVRSSPTVHKAALAQAEKIVSKQPDGTEVIQHLPWM